MRRLFLSLVAFFCFLFVASLFSCASSKGKERDDSFFYEENLPLFKEEKLSNNIPVFLKNIPFEKNIEIRIVFLGGASVCPKNKAGIDQLTFDLLSDGEPSVKELSSRGLYFPVSACLSDCSYYGFNCAAQDFFGYLERFAASILSPKYSHQDYLKKEAAASASAFDKSESLRYGLLESVKKRIYSSGHYLEGSYYKTTSRVSEYDIEKNLASLMNAERMVILAAGNFSFKEAAGSKGKPQKKTTPFCLAKGRPPCLKPWKAFLEA